MQESAKDRTIVVVEGTEKFRVEQENWVRLTGSTIAGGEVTAEVKGPAKLVRTNHIRHVFGGEIAIGAAVSEFELQPTGKGKVEVTLTKTSPIPGTESETETFVFDVE